MGIPVTMLVLAEIFSLALPQFLLHASAAAADINCTLIVPPQPLTAQGLATPYELAAIGPGQGPCNEANKKQAAFVQGAIFDPNTNQISIYNPLVVNAGQQPAVAPVVPKLPAGAVVGLWFGFNGTNLTLRGQNLQDSGCVNGLRGSIFGQVSYCNAPAFFTAVNPAIQAGKIVPPALGTGKDGNICPTVRDFTVVDMDPSDNVDTAYLIDNMGRTAQMTTANAAALAGATVQTNASDNRLASVALDGALGCTPWTAPDLADPGHNLPAQPLNELLAAAQPTGSTALVPAGDPMVKVNNNLNLTKLNLYRAGVDQPQVQTLNQASTLTYCQNLLAVAPQRIIDDSAFTVLKPTIDPMLANSLFTFMAQRFNTTWGANGLNCQQLVGQPSPLQLLKNGRGVVIDAILRKVGANGHADNQDTTTTDDPTANQDTTTMDNQTADNTQQDTTSDQTP